MGRWRQRVRAREERPGEDALAARQAGNGVAPVAERTPTGPLPTDVGAMAHADAPRVLGLQTTAGNRAVQRLVTAVVQRLRPGDIPEGSPPSLGAGLTVSDIVTKAVPKTPADGLRRGEICGNRRFGNYEGKLPRTDAQGRRISYTEYDTAPYSGRNRGASRIVIGSDGTQYHTGDHYRSFRRF